MPGKKCKAKNSKNKCVVYTAKHSTKRVADIHAKKVKARGGKVKVKKKASGYELEYSFPKKGGKKK